MKKLEILLTPKYIAKVFKETELAFINLGKVLNKFKKDEKVKEKNFTKNANRIYHEGV